MPRKRFALILTALLGACAHVPDNAHSIAQLQLRMPLAIPAGAATTRLQFGRITAFNAVQEREPFCVFEVESVDEQPRRIAPGRFEIVAMQRRVETFAGMPALPFTALRVGFGHDDGPSHIYYKTVFRLAPNPQQVRELTCMHNQQGVAIPRHLGLAEMRAALGEFFMLDVDAAR